MKRTTLPLITILAILVLACSLATPASAPSAVTEIIPLTLTPTPTSVTDPTSTVPPSVTPTPASLFHLATNTAINAELFQWDVCKEGIVWIDDNGQVNLAKTITLIHNGVVTYGVQAVMYLDCNSRVTVILPVLLPPDNYFVGISMNQGRAIFFTRQNHTYAMPDKTYVFDHDPLTPEPNSLWVALHTYERDDLYWRLGEAVQLVQQGKLCFPMRGNVPLEWGLATLCPQRNAGG